MEIVANVYVNGFFLDKYYLYKDRDKYKWIMTMSKDTNCSLYLEKSINHGFHFDFTDGDIEKLIWT